MSVSNTTFRLGFVPIVEPLLIFPVATYYARAQVTGDGSAGVATLAIDLTQRGPVSVEGVMLKTGAAEIVLIVFATRNPLGEQSSFNMDLALQTLQDANGTFTLRAADTLGPRQWPIDRGEFPGGVAFARLQTTMTNVDLATHEVRIWGYQWDRRSLTLPGGPKRPEGR